MAYSARAGAGANCDYIEVGMGAGAPESSTVLPVLEDEALALPPWIKAMRSASDVTPMPVGAARRFTEAPEEAQSARLDLTMACSLVATLRRTLVPAACMTDRFFSSNCC